MSSSIWSSVSIARFLSRTEAWAITAGTLAFDIFSSPNHFVVHSDTAQCSFSRLVTQPILAARTVCLEQRGFITGIFLTIFECWRPPIQLVAGAYAQSLAGAILTLRQYRTTGNYDLP